MVLEHIVVDVGPSETYSSGPASVSPDSSAQELGAGAHSTQRVTRGIDQPLRAKRDRDPLVSTVTSENRSPAGAGEPTSHALKNSMRAGPLRQQFAQHDLRGSPE